MTIIIIATLTLLALSPVLGGLACALSRWHLSR